MLGFEKIQKHDLPFKPNVDIMGVIFLSLVFISELSLQHIVHVVRYIDQSLHMLLFAIRMITSECLQMLKFPCKNPHVFSFCV